MTESNGRLDSWKEIARHLGRDTRTAMRWEAERGLPVHRTPGAKRSVVFAYREELDAWLAQHPAWQSEASPQAVAAATASPAPDRVRIRWAWAGVTVAVLAGIVVFVSLTAWATHGPVKDLSIAGTELRALDAQGNILWAHAFDAVGVEAPSGRWTLIRDLDADGERDVIAVVKTQRAPGTEVIDEMLSFSEDGRLRWKRVPDTRLRFEDGEYRPPWASEDLIAFESNGETRLAWAVRHYTWWPSMVMVLDATGAERGRFVNSGWIRTLGVSQDGKVLMASGITNAFGATFLALLDPDRVAGSSPEAPDSKYACLECGAGGPLQYFVLPRTDVSEHAVFPPLYAPVIQTFADGALQLRVSENGEPYPPEMLYEFAPGYSLQRARFSERFWAWHRRLEGEGLLTHDQRSCPLRGSLDVRHWTAGDGWRTVSVPSD